MSLREYTRKRNFQSTAEPEAARSPGNGNRFVVQKHAATRLHYDFRLEMDSVLKSWAVPKGIPFLHGEKHLAVEVEDHPVSYIHFEGTILKGQYGGGTVMVWDTGTFSTSTKSPVQEWKAGKLHVTLRGKKLKGDWHLVRLRCGNQWLMIRGGDDLKALSKKAEDSSALSGKSMKQLSENGAVWESKPRRKESSRILKPRERTTKTPKVSPSLKFIEPMKTRLVANPPESGNWIYEIKFDGYRALALKQGDQTTLLSRNEKDFGQRFPEIAEAVAALDVQDAAIDGEIVALTKKGVSSFQLLQHFEAGEERPPLYFYAFDLLSLNGKDLRREPLVRRKEQLEKILKLAPPALRFSGSVGTNARKLLQHAAKLGLEGLIAKRTDSLYEAGKRTGAWIKLKLTREQEFVIGGYTDPEGSRQHFGALLLGVYEKRKFLFCGKVGTGFDYRRLASLYSEFGKLERDTCPFSNLPEPRGSRYSPGLTAREMRRCHWVEPKLACQIKFSEWTDDNKLRQPVFLGLREDKNATKVVREIPE